MKFSSYFDSSAYHPILMNSADVDLDYVQSRINPDALNDKADLSGLSIGQKIYTAVQEMKLLRGESDVDITAPGQLGADLDKASKHFRGRKSILEDRRRRAKNAEYGDELFLSNFQPSPMTLAFVGECPYNDVGPRSAFTQRLYFFHC